MENLQANLFFLYDLGDPLDLESPTKVTHRRHVKQCTKANAIADFINKSIEKWKIPLTVSPL